MNTSNAPGFDNAAMPAPHTVGRSETSLPGNSLHSIFEARVRRYPNRIAVTCDDQRITYAELDAWSNAIASELSLLGILPDTIVPLCAERSVELIVGILAILKAGGAYLCIDPTLPPARVTWMIEDCGARLAVATPAMHSRLSETVSICVSVDWNRRPANPARVARQLATEKNLAYVIYTSGSSGLPKGVLIEHGSAVALFSQTAGLFQFDEHDVWTLFHSTAFDFSVWEIWGALLFGGRLIIPSLDLTRSPGSFAKLLRDEEVTVLNQTPTAFRQLIPELLREPASLPASLRVVFLGGERLDVPMLDSWIARHGDSRPRFVNLYGPTEITVLASSRLISHKDLSSPGISPIGTPLPQEEFLVLGSDGLPVADQQPGELHIGGVGVARGYLNRPDLSATHFVLRPELSPGRLYKTGDKVVRQADGGYAYLGRLDGQIKVRGFRIEPAEIEICICSADFVDACVVVAHDYGEGDARLIAYVVLKPGAVSATTSLDAIHAQLSSHCSRLLATHLRPSMFVPLAALPMTLSGKIDKASLPPPGLQIPTSVSPATPTQAKIAAIWCEILGRSAVHMEEDFTDMGGTSLTVMRMLNAVNTTFQTKLDLTDLVSLQKTTVVAVSACIDAALSRHTG